MKMILKIRLQFYVHSVLKPRNWFGFFFESLTTLNTLVLVQNLLHVSLPFNL